jgi:putative membrane protein
LVPAGFAVAIANFFLGCVLVAGIYGGLTASKKIIYIQALPALITLIVVNILNL